MCEQGQKCSCWFDSFSKWSWGDCCARHDVACASDRVDRLYADRLLFRCVKHRTNTVFATIMFIGVRIGALIKYDNTYFKKEKK